jgi:hypothetical protein
VDETTNPGEQTKAGRRDPVLLRAGPNPDTTVRDGGYFPFSLNFLQSEA